MRIALLLVAIVSCLACTAAQATADSPSWERSLSLPAGDISDIAFATESVGWYVGPGGVFRTEDGGRSWAIASSADVGALYMTAAAPDGLHGWAAGINGNIAATGDGGRTWRTQSSGTDINLSVVAAIDDKTAIVGGWSVGFSDVIIEPQPYVFLRTTDAGTTWRQFRVDGGYRPQAMHSLKDGKHAWIAGRRCGPSTAEGRLCPYQDALLRSDDGGQSWSVVNTGNSFLRIAFVDARIGWGLLFNCDVNFACTQGVARTIDGGATWKTVRTPSTTTLSFASLNAFDANTALVYEQGCPNNVCVTLAHITSDAGATWRDVDRGVKPGQFVGPIAFFDETHGIRAIGEPQWTNDGLNWHAAEVPVVLGSGDFDFADPMTGWVAASKLLRTTDGGASWAPVTDKRFSSIDFTTASVGLGVEFSCSSTVGCSPPTTGRPSTRPTEASRGGNSRCRAAECPASLLWTGARAGSPRNLARRNSRTARSSRGALMMVETRSCRRRRLPMTAAAVPAASQLSMRITPGWSGFNAATFPVRLSALRPTEVLRGSRTRSVSR